MNDEPVIDIVNLYKSFGDNHVLRDFNMRLRRGENVAILGKSGSGKSVLIKCIIGLIVPDKGLIHVFADTIPYNNQEAMDKMRSRVGFLFQSNALYDSMTVRENLEFPLRRHRIKEMKKEEVDQAVVDALKDVGLEHTIDMMPVELSGGMRKRIALARTLILRPEIILYDEPTTGLDPITAREISHLILEVQQKYNASSMIISHDLNCINITANRIVMLIDGKCYADDVYDNLRKSKDPKVKEFFDY
ncbi:MAG TPA: ATP-binding cassette domain-containing protein [Cyclobacteriaceae bacterium]|nr:ATP-binding cassette domain-containing protein [Cyclobacteriaceae bacterium]